MPSTTVNSGCFESAWDKGFAANRQARHAPSPARG
jgi:hypothetical protein